jgi:glycosyltransferase involved in cell wall biosynthesis
MTSTTPAPIRVVHLISGLAVGGTEMMLYKLLQASRTPELLHNVVSLTDAGSLGPRIEALGVPVHALGLRRGVPEPFAILRLRRLLRQDRPDVLQTWLYHADLLGLIGGKLAGVPSIVWNIRCSVMDQRYERGIGRLVLRALAALSRRPDVVVANSQAGIDLHRRIGYQPRRWELLPNGFDLSRFRPDAGARASVRAELGVEPGTPLVGLVARLDPVKDHANFLCAARGVGKTHPHVHFVLVGTGVQTGNPVIEAMLSDFPQPDRVHLLGERGDVARLTAALDVATCCSTGEGFPNIIGEAMACGVPVVTTDVGDAAHVVADTGLVVPPRDCMQLAAAWIRLLDLPQPDRQALGQRALARIARQYDLTVVARRYAALYCELAARAQRN